MIKNMKLLELNISVATVSVNKEDLAKHKCLICNKNCQLKFDEKLKNRFFNTSKFSDHYNNKFILLLQKGVYPYR